MIGDLQRRLVELRFLEGIEKVEHVPYPTGDQFWVRFNRPLDFAKLQDLVTKHNYRMVKFAGLPSKLPGRLSEMLWDGVTHIIVKKINGWTGFKSSLGFEPEAVAKIANDLHGSYQIFMATDEEGIELLYEYLGLKYVAPAPPPSPPKLVAVVSSSVVKPVVVAVPQRSVSAASLGSPPTPIPQAQPAAPQTSTATTESPKPQQQGKKDTSTQAAS